jgi:hypothetical protein
MQLGTCRLVIDVTPPANPETDASKICAIVTIKTLLPRDVVSMIGRPHMAAAVNATATLGALYRDKDGFYVGSRLTVYEQDDAWN